jgi:hypothetical protein
MYEVQDALKASGLLRTYSVRRVVHIAQYNCGLVITSEENRCFHGEEVFQRVALTMYMCTLLFSTESVSSSKNVCLY